MKLKPLHEGVSSSSLLVVVDAFSSVAAVVPSVMTPPQNVSGEAGTDLYQQAERLEARARQNVVLCILSLLFNCFLLVVIGLSPRLRRLVKYQLITSLAVADVTVVGVLYLPLDTTAALQRPGGQWPHSCGLLLLAYGMSEFVKPALSALTLGALCLDYAATVACRAVTRPCQLRLALAGVVLPWALGASALLVVFHQKVVTSSGVVMAAARAAVPACQAEWQGQPWAWVLLLGLYGFTPFVLLLAALVIMVICHCRRPGDHMMMVRNIISRSEGVYLNHEMADTFFACLLALAFNLPVLADLSLALDCHSPGGLATAACRSPPGQARRMLEVLRTAQSVVFPAVWMLGLEFRQGLLRACSRCYSYCDLEEENAFPDRRTS